MLETGRGERVPTPSSRDGSWAGRGRPQAGLRHAPCAAALFAFKSPGAGGGEDGAGGRDGVLAWTLCFGVSRSPSYVCLCPSLEGWSGEN